MNIDKALKVPEKLWNFLQGSSEVFIASVQLDLKDRLVFSYHSIFCISSWKPECLTLWPRNTVDSPTEFREISGIQRKS